MKRLVNCAVLLLIGMILWTGMALAVNLNSPGEKKVTLGSEIKRGNDAIFEVTEPDPLLTVLDRYDRVFNLNKQKNTDSPGFLLGASFAAWQFLNMRLQSKIPQANKELAFKYASRYYEDFRKLQKQMKISDEQLQEAVGMRKPFAAEAARWESTARRK